MFPSTAQLKRGGERGGYKRRKENTIRGMDMRDTVVKGPVVTAEGVDK